MGMMVSADNSAASLAWLAGALEHARMQDQERLVSYLEAVLEDVLFETESGARL
jgi:hypothetical protein